MQKTSHLVLAALGVLSSLGGTAFACNSPPPPSVAKAFTGSDVVYLARVRDLWHEPDAAGSGGITETVVFEVLVAWKGPKRRGKTFMVRTAGLGPGGNCGGSVVNNPAWESEVVPGVGASEVPAHFSDVWLFYFSGKEPYSVDVSSRSLPLNLVDPSELAQLFRHPLKVSGHGI